MHHEFILFIAIGLNRGKIIQKKSLSQNLTSETNFFLNTKYALTQYSDLFSF